MLPSIVARMSRTFRNCFSTKAEAIAASHLKRMLCISDELRARPATEPLWDAIVNALAAQFQPGQQKGGKTSDPGRWVQQIRFVITEPAITPLSAPVAPASLIISLPSVGGPPATAHR